MATKIKAAILVDADNLSIGQAEQALKKLAEICHPIIKKAFGDFTGSAKSWTPEFLRWHGFSPVLHFPVTRFKNGADIAMCIAAMDIVHAKSVDAIVLFTSDSDFAALAARIRESGMQVVGVGDAKANAVLQGAFDRFVVVAAANKEAGPAPKTQKVVNAKKPVPKKASEVPSENTKTIEAVLTNSKRNDSEQAEKKLEALAQKKQHDNSNAIHSETVRLVGELSAVNGPVLLGQVQTKLKEKYPKFDVKLLGFKSLSKYFGSIGALDLVNNNRKVKLIKNK